MAFGRRKRGGEDPVAADGDAIPAPDGAEQDRSGDGAQVGAGVALGEGGPWDSSEVEDPTEIESSSVLDLGSVQVPMPAGGQVQVELTDQGGVRTVHVALPTGRLTIAAFAAPRSPGQWREVAGELAAQLRTDGAEVAIHDGPWGREVVGSTATSSMRFLGVDGPRWMLRCVVSTTPDAAAALADTARAVLAETVVVRGTDPLPVRTPLPVVLPEPLVEQLRTVQAQAAAQNAQQQAAQAATAQRSAAGEPERDAAQQRPVAAQPPDGSAMDRIADDDRG